VQSPHKHALRRTTFSVAALAVCFLIGCVTAPRDGEIHRWWQGLGPVLPHDTFPTDCRLCHVGDTWNVLADDFTFDHERETGYALEGAHEQAQCLRCHNDRGPIATFTARGCIGCHEDFHQGELGPNCTSCHTQQTWRAQGQRENHARGRFPLVGAHAAVACHQCHPGAFVGRFFQADATCITCHEQEYLQAQIPPHVLLGYTDCKRCHPSTSWNHADTR
jgi:hypothetical protein